MMRTCCEITVFAACGDGSVPRCPAANVQVSAHGRSWPWPAELLLDPGRILLIFQENLHELLI